MVTYFLNFMGPISLDWYTKHDIPADEFWAGGRIDVHDGTPFGFEISVPIMSPASWACLGNFLWDLETKEPLRTLDEVVALFEKEKGAKLVWFRS